MRDRREQILSRIAEVCKSTKGVSVFNRNTDDISDLIRPAIILKDGSETARDINEVTARKALVNIVDLFPEVWVFAAGDDVTMPRDLNLLRMRLIAGITYDVVLSGITGDNGNIRYLGCDVRDQYGVLLYGAMILRWQITYPIIPTDFTT